MNMSLTIPPATRARARSTVEKPHCLVETRAHPVERTHQGGDFRGAVPRELGRGHVAHAQAFGSMRDSPDGPHPKGMEQHVERDENRGESRRQRDQKRMEATLG